MTNTSTIANRSTSKSHELSSGGIWKGGAVGAAAGAVANSVLYFIASAAGVDMVAEFAKGAPSAPMPFPSVVIASFVPFVFAALVATLLNRFLTKASRPFLGVAVAFALLSMGGPATLGGASTGLRIVLAAMHVVSAVTIAGGIVRLGRATAHA